MRRAIRPPDARCRRDAFLALVRGDEEPVDADKGCDGWYQQDLVLRGIADGIMVSSHRQRPLDARGHARNRAIGKLRAPVERTFAILKRWYGYRRVRYRSLVRNTLQLQRPAVARTRARTGSAD